MLEKLTAVLIAAPSSPFAHRVRAGVVI